MPSSQNQESFSATDTSPGHHDYSHGVAPLSPAEFDFFSRLILSKTGIEIKREKIGLMESRLRKRLTALKLDGYAQYKKMLSGDHAGREVGFFVNSLTTNKTEFFREQFHFETLRESLKQHYRHKTVYIWSAACSSGEEVYSLAMLCESIIKEDPAFDYKILGSDIDSDRVKSSTEGIYEADALSNMPKFQIQKHFTRTKVQGETLYRVGEPYRRNVKFMQHNLIDCSSRIPLTFDYIFLRNVLFYFSKNTAEKVVSKLVDSLVPGGLIFVGLTETLEHMDVGIVKVGASVYQKEGTA